jgi:CoA-binding domain
MAQTTATQQVPEVATTTAPPVLARPRGLVTTDFLLAIALVGDALMILVGLLTAFWIRFKSGWITFGVDAYQLYDLGDYVNLICVGATFLLVAFGYLRLYDRRNLLRRRRVALTMFRASSFWLFAYVGVSLALKFQPPISRIYVFLSYVGTLTALLGWRWCFHHALSWERIAGTLRQRVVFVGWNEEARRLAAIVESDPSHPYQIVGRVFSPSESIQSEPPSNVPLLGEFGDLDLLLKDHRTDIVVLADLSSEMTQIVGLANQCEKEFVQFKVIPSYFQILVSALQLETISGVPILGISELALDRPTNRFLKRAVDVVGSLVGLLLALLLVAASHLLFPGTNRAQWSALPDAQVAQHETGGRTLRPRQPVHASGRSPVAAHRTVPQEMELGRGAAILECFEG